MNLGELIDKLKKANPNAVVELVVDKEFYSPNEFDSYRGYYDQLAISKKNIVEEVFVKDFLDECFKCLYKSFQGYKGGFYSMDLTTPIWVSEYGECDNWIITGASSSTLKFTINTEYED